MLSSFELEVCRTRNPFSSDLSDRNADFKRVSAAIGGWDEVFGP